MVPASLSNISTIRPVLLLQDGCSSHILIEYEIELARQNDVQPYLKATRCHVRHTYIINHPGRVITSDVIAAIVAEAWTMFSTPVNITGRFKIFGIYSTNPAGEVSE